ncbi:MAG: damage-inducible protein [Ignavibacteria bacterium]|nr:damage-inducible protein [Ignavibacteria bacterium]
MADDINSKEDFNFEDFRKENGISYWWASDLMENLGYKDMKSFQKAIDRAIKACLTLNIKHYDNFMVDVREHNGEKKHDYKLTRFACYLTVMNSDPKKELVAKAQVYFAEQTRKFEMFLSNNDEIERLLIRDEIKEGNKSLASVVKASNILDYARFNNAGYLGLYNMMNFELAKKRNIDSKELFDYMGRTELAANLFRITQTEERVKNYKIKGQQNLEQTHYNVGKEVREIVRKNTGKNPENLPKEKRIPELQKELKQGYKKMLKADTKKKK